MNSKQPTKLTVIIGDGPTIFTGVAHGAPAFAPERRRVTIELTVPQREALRRDSGESYEAFAFDLEEVSER